MTANDMTLDEWRFSARLAWQDRYVRWFTIANAALLLLSSSFLLWRLIPEGARSGVLTFHYNIYLGIDDVRSWSWIFAIPGGAAAVFLLNTSVSFGVFRNDALASRALVALATAVLVVGGVASFFLVLINL